MTTRVKGLAIVPFALALHNAEEGLAMKAALPRLEAAWSRMLGRAVDLPSAQQYNVSLAVLTAVAFALLLLARLWSPASYALVVLQAVMTLNVLTHVLAAVVLGGYAPGLVTALAVEAPTSAIVFSRLRRTRALSPAEWLLLPVLAVLLHGPGLVGLLLWARSLEVR